MAELTFIHTCDLHLEGRSPERLEVLRWILNNAKEKGATVLICGDLFESDREATNLRPTVREIFNEYPEVKVFILPGNHDSQSYTGGEDYGRPVRVLSRAPLELLDYQGVTLVAAPFVSGANLANALAAMPTIAGPAILLAHGTYFGGDSALWREVQERGAEYYPIYPRDFEGAPFKFVALGHFHTRFARFEESGVTLCYPGSPTPITRAEMGIRHVALVTVDTGSGEVEVQQVPVEAGNYYILEEFALLPGLEGDTFSRLDTFLLDSRNSRAEVIIRLTGVTGWSDARISERFESLRQAHGANYGNVKLVNAATSYEELMRNPLVEEFVKRLESGANLVEETRRLAIALGLRAFNAAIARRR